MTSIHSRYQVGDACCGMVDWYARKSEAVYRARSHRDKRKRENDPREVRVTDIMHHRNRPATVFVANVDGETRSSKYWE
jgi:hypothetical protein